MWLNPGKNKQCHTKWKTYRKAKNESQHNSSPCIFSVRYPNNRHFSFLQLWACQRDHTAERETCHTLDRPQQKRLATLKKEGFSTYWREWPGLHVLWAPPETHSARRNPHGGEWEMEEEPLTWSEEEREIVDGHDQISKDGRSLMSVSFVIARLCWPLCVCASLLQWSHDIKRGSDYGLLVCEVWRGTYETRMNDTLH